MFCKKSKDNDTGWERKTTEIKHENNIKNMDGQWEIMALTKTIYNDKQAEKKKKKKHTAKQKTNKTYSKTKNELIKSRRPASKKQYSNDKRDRHNLRKKQRLTKEN